MEFAVLRVIENDYFLIGKYDTLEDAKAAAKEYYESSKERMMVIVIKGNLDENNRPVGKYLFYGAWY